ncbi:hypothetical protein V3423_03245 [Pseudomonas aeruginosa]|jgi:hypothetical protein|uniref:hypothetical protein n=1 Tax=Pseudomonas aeruginosa TaxID=287 RepID=UPI002F4128AC
MNTVIMKARRTGLTYMAQRIAAQRDEPYKCREFEAEMRLQVGGRDRQRGQR